MIWWVDNEAARYALIKGRSLSRTMNVLVREFYDADSSHSSYGWIERVPSYSNGADDPSRGRPEVAWAHLRGSHLNIRVISFPESPKLQLVKSKGKNPDQLVCQLGNQHVKTIK